MVFGDRLEPTHCLVLQRLLPEVLFTGIHHRRLPHVSVIYQQMSFKSFEQSALEILELTIDNDYAIQSVTTLFKFL